MKTSKIWIAIVALTALSSAAQATLIDKGDGTVLDTATNLVWLQNWNVNGGQNWNTQVAWADNLTFAGSSDWFLPGAGAYTTLFGEVGDLTAASVFTNVQSGPYWTSDSSDQSTARFFFATNGNVFLYGSKSDASFDAVAVRAAVPTDFVPEPPTLTLLLAALAATAVARRRRSR